MLKLSRLSDYAVVVLSIMQQHPKAPLSAAFLAGETHLPEPTVAKILKLLGGYGLIRSVRGVKGGYLLEKDLAEISVKDVINALDGPIALTACVETAKGDCELAGHCHMHGRWDMVNRAIKQSLASISIADMVAAPIMKESA